MGYIPARSRTATASCTSASLRPVGICVTGAFDLADGRQETGTVQHLSLIHRELGQTVMHAVGAFVKALSRGDTVHLNGRDVFARLREVQTIQMHEADLTDPAAAHPAAHPAAPFAPSVASGTSETASPTRSS